MVVDNDYYLDPETQSTGPLNSKPLWHGQTVFFVVQPKYLNVDIRLTIDIQEGSADVFISDNDKTFQVGVDSSTWEHQVSFELSTFSFYTRHSV